MRHAIGSLLGLVAGIGATLAAQHYLAPRLPALLGGPAEMETTVVKKLREADRLLLTVETPDQVVLTTFTNRLEEIDMLVALGDHVTLRLPKNQPFVKDPDLARVRKPAPGDTPPPVTAEPPVPDSDSDALEPRDDIEDPPAPTAQDDSVTGNAVDAAAEAIERATVPQPELESFDETEPGEGETPTGHP